MCAPSVNHILTLYSLCLPGAPANLSPRHPFCLTSLSPSDPSLPSLRYHFLLLSPLFTSICFASPPSSHPRCLCSLIWHPPPSLENSSSDQHCASKPPLGSSAMTSRILLRQQLMREQLQEQERREQQRQQASQYPQTTASQTPAINVSVPSSLPAAAQVPMEVLKVRGPGGRSRVERKGVGVWCMMSHSYHSVGGKVSTSGIRRRMCHCGSLNIQGTSVFIVYWLGCVCACMCVCMDS